MANNINCTCGHSWSKASSSKKDMYVCHMCGKDNTMKDGGWLDNYGKKPNPNDVEVSVGPGYVGLGYDITGRNYSPAWGGQFEDGGNVAQGGKSIPVPTTADSARLYNAQIALNNFYAKEMKAGRIKRDLESEETFLPEIFPKGHTNNLKYLNQDNLDFYREKLAERDRFKGRGKFDDEYAEYFGLSSKQVNDLEKKGLGQTKGSSEYQKYYRDLITPMQNLAAPFALIDTRIAPRKTMYYYPTVGGYPGGDVMVYDYDPLAIKPYYARTDKEKLAWEKKYGKGTPTTSSTKKPTTSTEKSKTEPGKKKTAIVKKSEETKTKLIKPTESTKLTETKETKLTKPTKTEEIKPTPYTPTGSKKYILNGMEVSEEDFLGSGNTTGGSKRIIYSTPKIKDRKVLRLDGTPETDPEKIRKAMRAQEKNDDMAMGGSIPGAVGFTYARTAGSAPSNGKYAKKTKASAQNGKEMKFYQEGLDFKPNSIAQDGAIVDPMGQWAHPGEVTIIPSTDITMEGVDYPVLGISDTGDQQMMYPGEDYQFDGDYVTEYPMMQDGGWLNKFDQGKAPSDATRVSAPIKPLTKKEQKENVRINKQTQKNTEEYNKAIIADRKSKRETKGDVNVPGSFNISEKLKLSNILPESWTSPGGAVDVFDEYLNPGAVIGPLADSLGESIAARSPEGVATTLAMTLGAGALGFDPLGSSIKSAKKIGKHLTEKTTLKKLPKNKKGGWLSKFDTAQPGGTFMSKLMANEDPTLNKNRGDMQSYFPETKKIQEKPKMDKAIAQNEQKIKKQILAEAVANAKGKQATVTQDNRTSREKEIAQKKLLDLKMAEAKSTSPFTQTLSSFTPTGSNQAAGQIAAENIGQMTPMMGATRLFTTLTDPENNPYGIGQGNGFLANTLGTLGLLGDAFDVGAITNPAIASGLKRFTNKPSPKVNQLDNSGKFATEIVDPETGISKFVYELDNNPVANNYQPAKGSDFTGFQVKLYDKAKEISNAILDAFTNTSNYNKPLTSLESYKNWAKFIHPELEFVDPKIIKEIHKEGIKTLKKTGSLPKGEDASRQLGLYIRDRLADKIPSFADPVVTHPTTGKFMTYGPNQLHPNVLSKDELSIFEQIYKGDEQSGLHPQYRDLSTVPVKDWGYDINKLSAQELNLIDAYAHGYDQIMNARGSNQNVFNTSKFYQDKVEQLNQAIQKNKFPEATFVRRGANDYQVELLDPITYQPTGKLVSKNELKVGDVFKDEEFLSTSIGQEHAIGTPTASELVEIPGGGVQSYAYPNAASPSKYPNELEAILPKGLIRRVEEVRSPSSVDEFSNVKYPNNAKYRTKILNPYNLLLPLGGAALFGKEKKENGGWLTKYK